MCKITVIKVVTQRKKELKLGSAKETKKQAESVGGRGKEFWG